MENSTLNPEPTPPNAAAQEAAKRARMQQRRRLLIGGAPLVMTVISRPAFAWPQCTISRVLSGNLSQDQPLNPGETCAQPASCWVSQASGQYKWKATAVGHPPSGYQTSDNFRTVFGLPITCTVSGHSGTWDLSSTSTNLLSAINGGATLEFTGTNNNKNYTKTLSASFGGYDLCTQAVCALLNAAAFFPDGHFLIPGSSGTNTSPATIISWFKAALAASYIDHSGNLSPSSSSQGINGCGNNYNSSFQGSGSEYCSGL